MEKLHIDNLLALNEGVSLEFKKSLDFAEAIAKTICAFANTLGGYLVFGVEKQKDKTLVLGLSDIDAAFQKLPGIISQIQPKPYYEAIECKKDGKTLLVVKINALPISEVCFLKKSVFRRVGSINEEIFGLNLARFLAQRGTLSFEENKSSANLGDLSEDKVRILLQKRGLDTTKHEPLSLKPLLSSFAVANAVGDFYLKNAAVLFFSKEITNFFSNSEVRVVKYRGKEKALEAKEYDSRFSDTLPELLEEVFKVTQEKAGAFSRIEQGKRVETPMIPGEVLREALTNAVGHRDYFDPNGILIEIFDDRIELANPGSLLPGQTIKNFAETRKHRNPILYRLLNDSQWGEGLNLGIKAMYRVMRKNKLPDPLFEDLGGVFKVTLSGPLSRRKPRKYGDIMERQKKAIDYLKTHKAMTAPQYAKLAGISHPTAITDLNELSAQGVLSKAGRYRSSRYMLENIK
ncbi:putative DNA binding domain-containing protein [Candidatus Micrarchaeota archaeon]|nr:putative DNA binding domain-containing protein [Candidatus Micrarchaeota archaeon]